MNTAGTPKCIIRQIGGHSVWIDPYGRGSVSLPHEETLISGTRNIELVQLVDEKCRQLAVPFSYRLSLVIDGRALANRTVAPAIRSLCEAFSSAKSCRLEIHSHEGQRPDFDKLLEFANSLRLLKVTHPLITYGRFEIPTAKQMEDMFEVACLGVYTVNASAPRFGKTDGDVVSCFTDFGFLMPVRFLIGEQSLETIEEDIPKAIAANRSAGFSLPLVTETPFFDPRRDTVPGPSAYCDLLVRVYRSYPWFDNWLHPISELAMAFRIEGSYSQIDQAHYSLKFFVDQEGRVFRYRQVPAMSVEFGACEAFASADPVQIRSLLSEESVPSNLNCHGCGWEFICGGHDTFQSDRHDPDLFPTVNGIFNTHCLYRTLFIEHFASRLSSVELKDLFEEEQCQCAMTN
jgi:hypothetical protein